MNFLHTIPGQEELISLIIATGSRTASFLMGFFCLGLILAFRLPKEMSKDQVAGATYSAITCTLGILLLFAIPGIWQTPKDRGTVLLIICFLITTAACKWYLHSYGNILFISATENNEAASTYKGHD